MRQVERSSLADEIRDFGMEAFFASRWRLLMFTLSLLHEVMDAQPSKRQHPTHTFGFRTCRWILTLEQFNRAVLSRCLSSS